MKIYSDECLSPDFTEHLNKRGLEADCAQDQGFCGKPDEFHFEYAVKNEQFLITRNGKHFKLIAKGRPHYGVLCVEGDMQTWEYAEISIQIENFVRKYCAQLNDSIYYFSKRGLKWIIHK